MAWNRDRSLARIVQDLERLDADGGVTVGKLVREMDLDNLTDKRCREIFGAHVYVLIDNFDEYASSPKEDNEYKKFIRSVHVYQRIVHHIVESIFDSTFVHFQGPKLHALIYRPIDDATKIADRAVLLQLALREFVGIFNDATKAEVAYKVVGGCDIGNAIGTRNGQVKDRELLFIGHAANAAAKMISTGMRISQPIYDALSDDVKAFCTATAVEGIYKVSASNDDFAAAMSARNLSWNRESLRQRVEDEESAVPLSEIQYSDAYAKISPDALSIRDNKRVMAVSLFADVSGFTKFVASKTTDADKASALRTFQAIRCESSATVKHDYDGVRIQYQGDRMQVLYHMPRRDSEKIALEALEAACALQSAMEDTLRECIDDMDDIHYAIGLDMGETLVTKLGFHGERDRVCLGTAVELAQVLEDKVAGATQIAISKAVYDALPEYAQELFSTKGDAYVATGLTLDKLVYAEKAEKTADEVGIIKTSAGFAVTTPDRGTAVTTGSSWQV